MPINRLLIKALSYDWRLEGRRIHISRSSLQGLNEESAQRFVSTVNCGLDPEYDHHHRS
jgi:hypothetical protein